jgi:hypothetical protein
MHATCLPISCDHPNNICHTCTPTGRVPSTHWTGCWTLPRREQFLTPVVNQNTILQLSSL